MPTVQDVRDFLSKIAVQRVSDETITLTLRVAETIVDGAKSGCTTAQQTEDAKLVYAAWQTLIAYATAMELSAGTVPAPVMSHQAVLETLANQLLDIVKRGSPIYVPMNEQWDSVLKQYQAGELEEAEDFY